MLNESKNIIKKILREQLDLNTIKPQISNQITKMGLNPNDVLITLNNKPIAIENKELDEDIKSSLTKVLITCLVGATGLVSCKKAEQKFMYKASYKDAAFDSPTQQNMRGSSYYAYDHVLTNDEIGAEIIRLEPKTEQTLGIDIVDGTFTLEIDPNQGKWK